MIYALYMGVHKPPERLVNRTRELKWELISLTKLFFFLCFLQKISVTKTRVCPLYILVRKTLDTRLEY